MPLTIRRRLVDRVRQWRKIAYVLCAGLVVFIAAGVFLSVSSPASTVEPAAETTFFDAHRAYRFASEMVGLKDPQRTPDSPGAAAAATWLATQFDDLKIPIYENKSFHVTLGDHDVSLTNIAVVLPGNSRETILVTAPRDTQTIVKVNPQIYASGTAMLADLVQVFSTRPHEKTMIFLSTSDGNSGGLGISHFLATYPDASDITTIISMQRLGKQDARTVQVAVSGPQSSTPGWLLQLTSRVLSGAGLSLKVPSILSQAADHALSLSRGDQVAGLSRGIASLMLYDDGPGNLDTASLATEGAAVERLLLSLDSGTEAPPDPGTALLLTSGRYLTNKAMTFLAMLMLLPTIAALLIWLFSSRLTPRVALLHLRNLLSFALPVAMLFVAAYLLALTGLIPRYSLQVPTILGPSTQPRLAPTLILILLGGAVLVLSRRFLGYLRPREPRATTEMAKLITGFLSLLVGLALMLSRSPFLLLPCLAAAWAWPLATCFSEPIYSTAVWRYRFVSNAPLLLLGLITPFLLYSYVAVAQSVGWLRAWWFLVVQTVSGAYGVGGPAAFVFITAGFMVLLGVKRMRVVPIETLEITDELSLLEPPMRRPRPQKKRIGQSPLTPIR